MSSHWRNLLTVCLGLSGGLLASALGGTRGPVGSVVAERASRELDDAADRGRADHDDRAARVAARPGRRLAAAVSAGGPMAELRRRHTEQVEWERNPAVAQAVARWNSQLASHRSETLDRRWSEETTALFEDDLSSLSDEGPFQLLEVQCRSRTCSALLEWPDYPTALESYDALLHHSYTAPCARETQLPPPAEPATTYRATVLFKCGRKPLGI